MGKGKNKKRNKSTVVLIQCPSCNGTGSIRERSYIPDCYQYSTCAKCRGLKAVVKEDSHA